MVVSGTAQLSRPLLCTQAATLGPAALGHPSAPPAILRRTGSSALPAGCPAEAGWSAGAQRARSVGRLVAGLNRAVMGGGHSGPPEPGAAPGGPRPAAAGFPPAVHLSFPALREGRGVRL